MCGPGLAYDGRAFREKRRVTEEQRRDQIAGSKAEKFLQKTMTKEKGSVIIHITMAKRGPRGLFFALKNLVRESGKKLEADEIARNNLGVAEGEIVE